MKKTFCVFILFTLNYSSSENEKDKILFPSTEYAKIYYTNDSTIERAVGISNNLASKLLQLILMHSTQDTTNVFLSPVSLTGTLGQLMIGAKGELYDIIENLFSYDGKVPLEIHKEIGSLVKILKEDLSYYQFNIQNAFFISKDIKLQEPLKFALGDIYDVDIRSVEFQNVSSINKMRSWMEEATKNRISYFPDIPPSTVSMMVNTVYFKAEWKTPFFANLTKNNLFHVNETYQVPVEYMAGEVEILYGEEENLKIIGIPYKNNLATFYIILYENDTVIDQIKNVNKNLSNCVPKNVTLVIPKIKLSQMFNLRNVLLYPSNPLPLCFHIDENLLDSDKLGNFLVDDVLHVVDLVFNETGSEIASVTTTLIDYSGESEVIKVNRPFLFVIKHEETDSFIFYGLLRNPAG